MRTKIFLTIVLMLIGSYANASNVLIGNGVSWTTEITGIGTATGQITLRADVSGSTLGTAYLAGIGIKNLGNPETSSFTIVPEPLSLTNWSANNAEISASGAACSGGSASADQRQCVSANTATDRVAIAGGNLEIVLNVNMSSGVISDGYHFKVRWEDFDGNKVGSLISDDFSTVPIPAAAWLFGSALFGLIGVARRKRA
jgi:hypothetical protein